MRKILFLRNFKKISGGHVKVRDYFMHCLHQPRLDAYLYFTPNSKLLGDAFWAQVPADRIVREIHVEQYDLFFVAGKDWELLPHALDGKKIINLIQHVKHGDSSDERFSYLSRYCLRICVSHQVLEAIAPYANGKAVVIENGIPLELFSADSKKIDQSILIWARKNPQLGHTLYERLQERKAKVRLLIDYLPREAFAQTLAQSDVFVALPNRTEGFYLPALEAMAARCAVVCSDAIGNRSFCMDGQTCLMPEFDDDDSHFEAIDRLLASRELKEKIRAQGAAKAQDFSLQTERDKFYRMLEKFIQ
jgi:glycosyltransferase involved in cell wall biosynthesis